METQVCWEAVVVSIHPVLLVPPLLGPPAQSLGLLPPTVERLMMQIHYTTAKVGFAIYHTDLRSICTMCKFDITVLDRSVCVLNCTINLRRLWCWWIERWYRRVNWRSSGYKRSSAATIQHGSKKANPSYSPGYEKVQ